MKKLVISTIFAASLLSSQAIAQEGDAKKGERLYLRCKACHNLTGANRPRLGPNLNNIIGRQAGNAEGYRYSRALKEADFEWTAERLNEWLENPKGFLPGNRMSFPGLKKAEDRKNLITYLNEATKE